MKIDTHIRAALDYDYSYHDDDGHHHLTEETDAAEVAQFLEINRLFAAMLEGVFDDAGRPIPADQDLFETYRRRASLIKLIPLESSIPMLRLMRAQAEIDGEHALAGYLAAIEGRGYEGWVGIV